MKGQWLPKDKGRDFQKIVSKFCCYCHKGENDFSLHCWKLVRHFTIALFLCEEEKGYWEMETLKMQPACLVTEWMRLGLWS